MSTIKISSYSEKSRNKIAKEDVKKLFEIILDGLLIEYNKFAEHTNDDPLNYAEVAQRSFFLNALIRADEEHRYISLFEYHAKESGRRMADMLIMDSKEKKWSCIFETKHEYVTEHKDKLWKDEDTKDVLDEIEKQIDNYISLDLDYYKTNVNLQYKVALVFDTVNIKKESSVESYFSKDGRKEYEFSNEDFYQFYYSEIDGKLSHGLHVYGKIVEI